MSIFEDTLAAANNDRACPCGMLSAELLSLCDETVELARGFLSDCRDVIAQIFEEWRADDSFDVVSDPKNMAEIFLATLEGEFFISRVERGAERSARMVRQLERSVSV